MPAEASELASFPLFHSLSEAELGELATWFEAKEVAAGVQLVGEGVTGHSFFVVCGGEVVITVRDEKVATLQAGDFFGEVALLGAGRRTATVTTTTRTRVLVLFGNDFSTFREKYPVITAELEAAMERRVRRS